MLRLGLEDGPTLIGKLLTAMIHQCDLAVPSLEMNQELCRMRMNCSLPPQHPIGRGCTGLSSVLLAHCGEQKLNCTSNGWGDVLQQSNLIVTNLQASRR